MKKTILVFIFLWSFFNWISIIRDIDDLLFCIQSSYLCMLIKHLVKLFVLEDDSSNHLLDNHTQFKLGFYEE